MQQVDWESLDYQMICRDMRTEDSLMSDTYWCQVGKAGSGQPALQTNTVPQVYIYMYVYMTDYTRICTLLKTVLT